MPELEMKRGCVGSWCFEKFWILVSLPILLGSSGISWLEGWLFEICFCHRARKYVCANFGVMHLGKARRRC